MAKKGKVERNKKKQEYVARHMATRIELRKVLKSPHTSYEEKEEAQRRINRLPRMSMPNRVRNRCELTGRPRGYLRKFQMSRLAVRELANFGRLPGVTKSSW